MPGHGMTRRQALQLGAATSAAAMLGGPTALARAATSGTPKHLLRSSYLPLAGQQFRVGGKLLQLGVVDDLAGAEGDSDLRGHPEAFALTFYGPPNALGATVQTFSHPAIGTYSLLLTPVGAVEGQVQRYEVVVDRSVGAPRNPPAPAKGITPPPEHPGSEEAAAEALTQFRKEVVAEARQTRMRINRRRRIKRRKLRRRRKTRARSVAAKRRAAMKRAAERGEQVAVRGAVSVIG